MTPAPQGHKLDFVKHCAHNEEMFVVTIDQENSRKVGDRVPHLLAEFDNYLTELWEPRVKFSRSVGDEVQGVLDNALSVLAVLRIAMRSGGWYVGIGIGSVNHPLPQRSADGYGHAFVHARAAVEDAKTNRGLVPVSVNAGHINASDPQALLRLLAVIFESRSAKGWEAVDLVAHPDGTAQGRTQGEAAAILGVTKQALSARIKAARWDEERGAVPLAVRLLDETNKNAS